MSGIVSARTERIDLVESAHLYLCDIWGNGITKRKDGRWQMVPDYPGPKTPIVMDDFDLIGLAASQGWRRG